MTKFMLQTETGTIGFSSKNAQIAIVKAHTYMEKARSTVAQLLIFNDHAGKYEPKYSISLAQVSQKSK